MNVLGILQEAPIHLDEMARSVCIAFYPEAEKKTLDVYKKLQDAFGELGIKTIDFEQALTSSGKIREGVTVITDGRISENSPVKKVSSLFNNPILGVFCQEAPVKTKASNQERLNGIISILAEHAIHIAIYVKEDDWTIYTMNGSIINFSFQKEGKESIFNSLVPKLTGLVSPPQHLCKLVYRPGQFDIKKDLNKETVMDFSYASEEVAEDGSLLSHAPISSFSLKDKFKERIVRLYLDERSGMSFGFLVWQLPLKIKPAVRMDLFEGSHDIQELHASPKHLAIYLDNQLFYVEVPEIWVISTRSGCNKSALDVNHDLVRMGLVDGRIIFDTPKNLPANLDCKPSYDTLTILAHALGNVIVASILKTIKGDNRFTNALETKGISLFHWHGYTVPGQLLNGYFFHGYGNPSVSCSTPQSAIYTLYGKLEALKNNLEHGIEFLGDVHVEPHHGTNITSVMALSEVIRHIRMV